MADAAVRVDIVVGQNTVVPAVQQTERTLAGAGNTAARTNAGFASLSSKGLKSVEVGFRQLAFQAAGVPGPMGKIAEGALLLGGGSGLLLGVAAAAGAVALAWQAMTKHSRELTQAIKDLQEQLPKNDKPAEDLAKLWKEYGDMMRRATELEAKANRPGAMFSAASLLEDAAALRVKAAELRKMLEVAQLTLPPMGGRDNDRPQAGGGARAPGRVAETGEMAAAWARNEEFVKQSQQINLMAQAYAQLNAVTSQTPAIMEGVAASLDSVEQGLRDANEDFVSMFDNIRDGIEAVLPALAAGFEAIGASLAGVGNLGKALVNMFRQALVDLARMHVAKELAEAAEAFASGAWPPNPLAIAAGLKHLKAAALWGVAGGVASAVGGGVSSSAAGGGVSGSRFERDQRQVAPAGTVTVKMGDGFIRASDPAFQEFLAEVIKQGKGRNVVFA